MSQPTISAESQSTAKKTPPADAPVRSGSASGLPVIACKIAPASASIAPATTATRARGSRRCQITSH